MREVNDEKLAKAEAFIKELLLDAEHDSEYYAGLKLLPLTIGTSFATTPQALTKEQVIQLGECFEKIQEEPGPALLGLLGVLWPKEGKDREYGQDRKAELGNSAREDVRPTPTEMALDSRLFYLEVLNHLTEPFLLKTFQADGSLPDDLDEYPLAILKDAYAHCLPGRDIRIERLQGAFDDIAEPLKHATRGSLRARSSVWETCCWTSLMTRAKSLSSMI